jgi:hypothetical protein
MTFPERIRHWVSSQFAPHHVDKVTEGLIDAAAGNRPASPWEEQALKHIFPEAVQPPRPPQERHCRVIYAGIGSTPGEPDDGAYGLFDVSGSPLEIGAAIAEELRASDIFRGRNMLIADNDDELYLTVRIKFARHPVADDDTEHNDE